MGKKIAIYPGTFDPPTLGHRHVICLAVDLFDKLYIVAAHNPEKKTSFAIQERKKMLEDMMLPKNVEVVISSNQYTVNIAKKYKAQYLVRGIRNETDFQYEKSLKSQNFYINPEIESVYLMPPPHLTEVKSSDVKKAIGFEGWEDVIYRYVPENVFSKLLHKYEGLKIIWQLQCHKLQKQFNITVNTLDWYRSVISAHIDRYYHGLNHLYHCLKSYEALMEDTEALKLNEEERLALFFALMHHDIIYNTKATNNEKESAAQADRLMGAYSTHTIPKEFRDLVQSYIMATTHKAKLKDLGQQFIADIDIAQLAQPWKVFVYQNWAIEQEYRHVPRLELIKGRLAILKQIRNKNNKQIFYTDYFKKNYEVKACENLDRLIASFKYQNRNMNVIMKG